MQLLFLDSETEETILGIIVIAIILGVYLAICAGVGKYAKNRGRSFIVFFLISLLNPVLGFLIAAILGETRKKREERIRRETQIRMEEEYRYRQQFNQNQFSSNYPQDTEITLQK